ncbi:hypothetical protein Nepgr_029621 [Nepenthes gracilis]|uniref:indole-3-pyruvate monooxygenase n=1 Tax=Nepenthes gracilis TaxID=150966 RepID=A0AAD3Y3E9_NEPGR|nr:hypothetical protein Nepgr_029621 [Nepenthes gracilis]
MDSSTNTKPQEATVIIVGAGPSGLATAACLHRLSIPYIILEREDCCASLWKKKSYDRVYLHLPKQYCQLPHMSLPQTCPKYVSKKDFIQYMDDYVARFHINPLYRRCVEAARYDGAAGKWRVKVKNGEELYVGRFLVVATGESTDPFTPNVEGMSTFTGKVVHSTEYRSGMEYRGMNVLVVGSGNSGMEIALDLANHGANTSVVVRSPTHVLSREMMHVGLFLVKHLPLSMVDWLLFKLSEIVYGDLTEYGIARPKEGPILMKAKYGKYPIIDVGTINKILSHEIQVLPTVLSVRGSEVLFDNGRSYAFNAIIFATGFRRSTNKWLLGDDYLLNENGLPKPSFPNHWKGENGLYCVGLARRGLYGAAADAQQVADDIKALI